MTTVRSVLAAWATGTGTAPSGASSAIQIAASAIAAARPRIPAIG